MARKRRPGRQDAAVSEQTRRELALAALHVFSKRGFRAASLRDIATEAGTAHALIRHHFGSKEGAWRAAADLGGELTEAALAPYLSGMTDETIDPVAHAKESMRAVLAVNRQHPETTGMLIHEGLAGGRHLDYVLGQRFERFSDLLAPLLERLHRAGYLRQFDLRSLYLFLLTAGLAPSALGALTAGVLKVREADAEQVSAHIERVLSLLFPDT